MVETTNQNRKMFPIGAGKSSGVGGLG